MELKLVSLNDIKALILALKLLGTAAIGLAERIEKEMKDDGNTV